MQPRHGLLLLMSGWHADKLASNSQTQLQLGKETLCKDRPLPGRIMLSLGAVLQVKLKSHSVAKEKADARCSDVISAAERADAAQTTAPAPADLWLVISKLFNRAKSFGKHSRRE